MAGSSVDSYSYILMKDVWGEKAAGRIISVLGGTPRQQQVLRGELLVSIPDRERIPHNDGKPTHNFRSKKDPNVTLFGGEDDVAPLNRKDVELLVAIEKPCDRFAVFSGENKLEWGGQLNKGDQVYVKIPSANSSVPTWSAAVVKYVGTVESLPGRNFGVEIKEPHYRGRGSTDGAFGGYQYFQCEEDCGLFVSLDKLSLEPVNLGPQGAAQQQLMKQGTSSTLPPRPSPQQSASQSQRDISHSMGSTGDSSHRPLKQTPFKINDRVVVYNKNRFAVHGTVRWAGRHVQTKTMKINHIGIETDTAIYREAFPKALSGGTQLFNATPGHRLVVPEDQVFREDLAAGNKQPINLDPSDPETVAREYGLTEKQLIVEQKKALKEAEDQKKKEDKARKEEEKRKRQQTPQAKDPTLVEVKDALGASISMTQQHRILGAIEQEKKDKDRSRSAPQPRPRGNIQGGGQGVQRQDSKQASESSQRQSLSQTGVERIYDTIPGDKENSPSARPRHAEGGNSTSVGSVDQGSVKAAHEQAHQQQQIDQKNNHGRGGSCQASYPNQAVSQDHYSNRQQYNHGNQMAPRNGQERMEYPNHNSHHPDQYGNCQQYAQNNQEQLYNEHDDDYVNVPAPTEQFPQGQQLVQGDQRSAYNMVPGDQGYQPQHRYQGGNQHSGQSNYQGTPHGQHQGSQQKQVPYDAHPINPPTIPPSNAHQHAQPIVAHTGNATLPANIHLGVGSIVELANTNPNMPPRYGVIRWIGTIAGVQGQIAGIELDDDMEGCTDGTFQSTGEKLFQCPQGHGLYYPLANLRPDQRFGGPPEPTSSGGGPSHGNPLQVAMEEQTDQFIHDSSQQMMKYIGNKKGIQGHQNSCYLDSTVFGLFALSDVFDTMFLGEANKTADQNRKAISDLLWKGIVNPLRKNGVVRFESVMMLRNKLEELGKMEGITEKEKDPEEFLNMLFKHMLRTTPFISIKRPFGTEQEFFVQLFVEYDANLRLPTVGDLLRKMFTEQNISFTKVPSRLLIQVPRFGREFKTFQKIVPDLKLRITDLTDTFTNAQVPSCYICGHKSLLKCVSCGVNTYYCQRCSDLFHQNQSYKDRADHIINDAVDVGDVSELDLLSVICIETSHYVCFTRDPRDDQENKWIFFDSMADRQYDTYNIPKVTDCTRDLNEWVYPSNGDRTRLMSTQPRQLPELVRRFTQDVYMCVYIQPDVAMYGDDDV